MAAPMPREPPVTTIKPLGESTLLICEAWTEARWIVQYDLSYFSDAVRMVLRPDTSLSRSALVTARNLRSAGEMSSSRQTSVRGAVGAGGNSGTNVTPRRLCPSAAACGTSETPTPAATKLTTVCRCLASCTTRGMNPDSRQADVKISITLGPGVDG
jgi:hypothetical protein